MSVVVNDAQNAQVRADEEEAHRVKMLLISQLEEIRDGIEDELSAELSKIMLAVQQLAIEMCPKDTGALASSITLDNSGAVQAGDFYGNTISAGSENIVNPVSGKPTAEYALFVHDGHAMPNGMFYEGVPFLTEAMLMFESELESAVDKAMKELSGD